MHKFLQVAITFFCFWVGEEITHYTMCIHNTLSLLSLLKTFKFRFISFFVDVVANIEVVVINPKWDAFQTIVVDPIKDFASHTLVMKWKCVH